MNEQAQYMFDRIDEAYKRPYNGTWFERWIPGICSHSNVRCTHGDEIIHRKFRRRVCLTCGRSLRGSLPVFCFFTGEDHPGVKGER